MHELKWTEARIAEAITRQAFKRAVLAVPNCYWPGEECDLLIIEKGLRVIDVEIKISRSDLKADLKKDKWWHHQPWSRRAQPRTRREWPPKVWKHYYVMPHDIWKPDLEAAIPAVSGVLTMRPLGKPGGPMRIDVMRAAKPNKDAQRIAPHDCIDIARLASLRMWAAINARNADAQRTLSPTRVELTAQL